MREKKSAPKRNGKEKRVGKDKQFQGNKKRFKEMLLIKDKEKK